MQLLEFVSQGEDDVGGVCLDESLDVACLFEVEDGDVPA